METFNSLLVFFSFIYFTLRLMTTQVTHQVMTKVVSVAEDLFMRLGVRSITMDQKRLCINILKIKMSWYLL